MKIFKDKNTGQVKPRPDWAEPVKITTEDLTLPGVTRPTFVIGIVVPTETKGRPDAPPPICAFSMQNNATMDRGHLMALELGGPDISENIVPQFSQFQQNGPWKQAETAIKRYAIEQSKHKRLVKFTCAVFYSKSQTQRRMRIPSRFTVTTTLSKRTLDVKKDSKWLDDENEWDAISKVTRFEGENNPTSLDDLIHYRTFEEADYIDYKKTYNDLDRNKKGNLVYGDGGQDPKYSSSTTSSLFGSSSSSSITTSSSSMATQPILPPIRYSAPTGEGLNCEARGQAMDLAEDNKPRPFLAKIQDLKKTGQFYEDRTKKED
jgi:hypothetical protein